jgi:membrane protein YqaA with SNARE-associated domain
MSELASLVGLFAAAFLAATILPAQSEAVLVALIVDGDLSPVLLVAVASLGNVLGAVVNWILGRSVEQFRDRRWFPVRPEALARAQAWYHRFGRWSLLFSWLPIVGDPLTVVAGTMREPLRTFLPLVAAGKVARYVVIAAGVSAAAQSV